MKVEQYAGLLIKRAHYWQRRTQDATRGMVDEDDFFQIGLLGLLSYKGELNYPLASRIIDNKIVDVLRGVGSVSRRGEIYTVVDIEDYLFSDPSPNPLEALIRKNAIEELLKWLTPREQDLLIQYLRGYTMKEIGRSLGVTESRICQLWKDVLEKGGKIMPFKSENSSKWKVFTALASLETLVLASVETIEKDSDVGPRSLVQKYLGDFARIIPEYVQRDEEGLFSYNPHGKTPEEVYQKLKDYYNEKARDAKIKKRNKEGKSKSAPLKFDPSPEVKPTPVPPPSGVFIPMTVLNEIRQRAIRILNPIVAFRFDSTELLHNVIREEQRQAEEILAMLAEFPLK